MPVRARTMVRSVVRDEILSAVDLWCNMDEMKNTFHATRDERNETGSCIPLDDFLTDIISFTFCKEKAKLGAYAMKRVVAGAHFPTPWLFEPAKRPDKTADYCLNCSFLP